MLFLVEDNGYAISVPVEVQTAGGSISKLVAQFSASARRGVRRHGSARKLRGAGPRRGALPRAQRARAGSRARDASLFPFAFRRRKALQDARRARGGSAPRSRSRNSGCSWCAKAFSTRSEMEALEAEVEREILDATDRALAAEPPATDSIYACVYSPDVDPTAKQFEAAAETRRPPQKRWSRWSRPRWRTKWRATSRIVVFGEDVADCSREESLRAVKGKGGVFKATLGVAAPLRQGPRLQYAARRGGHRRPRHWNGHARDEARRRNSILRLHLAGHDAASRRAGRVALALGRDISRRRW